ncbi:MAG: hypothetical protein NTY06_03910 [Candidatus Gottesmanbacteria bacterium]|nr:hypothetical protein [Candidatus Gottesmanbacteria bacterium]
MTKAEKPGEGLIVEMFNSEANRLLGLLHPLNTFRPTVSQAIDDLRGKIELTAREESILALREAGMQTTFLQFEAIVKTMTSPGILPPNVIDIFQKRLAYYKFYSTLPPQDRKIMDPNSGFLEWPFVDLWGSWPRNLQSLHGDYIPGNNARSADLSANTFMTMATRTKDTLGANVVPDYIMSDKGNILKIITDDFEDDMCNSGHMILTLKHFPNIVGHATVASAGDKHRYNFNNSELRKKFIKTALEEDNDYYILSFGFTDVGENLPQNFT